MHYYGSDRLLKLQKAAILNSRQTKKPLGSDQWIRATYQAVKEIVSNGTVVISSIGMNTWEFLVWAVSECGGEQIILIPVNDRDDEHEIRDGMLEDFELDPDKTGFMLYHSSKKGSRHKSAWNERDRLVVSLANQLYPVSVRPNGNLDKLMRDNPSKLSTASLKYSIEYNPVTPPEKVSLTEADLCPEVLRMDWKYVTHFTRSTYAPWPGESSAQFYGDIFNSGDNYPRSACESLKRIVAVQKIWGSFHHIRGGHKVVAFTELPPVEAIRLIRWRRRYVRWSFEPYGVAIDKDYARQIGIRPVIYDVPERYQKMDSSERPFYQNPGEKGGDWEPEQEWRYYGNLLLNDIPANKIKLIVRNKSDRIESPYEVIHLTEFS